MENLNSTLDRAEDKNSKLEICQKKLLRIFYREKKKWKIGISLAVQ